MAMRNRKLWIPLALIVMLAAATVVYAMVIEGREGNLVSATSEGHLNAKCITVPLSHHTNHHEKETYVWNFALTPSAANAEFVYMKNTAEEDLVIDKLLVAADTDEIITILHTVTGTASTYTDTEGVNLNAGSGNLADCDYYISESITGLSAGSLARKWYVDGGTGTKVFDIPSGIILPKNATMMMTAKAGSISLTGTIVGYFHEAD